MITGVVLARNEEKHIEGCLESLSPHVRELLLIDMESSDKTVALARPLVNRVLPHPQLANFDVARNLAIPEASHDWIWFLDADERVPPDTGNLVNEIVRDRGQEFVAITIPFRTYFCGKWIQNCGWWPGYTMPRVLKRGHFRFSEQLHQGVEFHGAEFRLPPDPQSAIQHFSYESIAHYVEKFNRYTSTEATYLNQPEYNLDWRNGIDHLVHDLWQYYELHRGDRDGFHGWVLSWLAGQYRWFTHAKVLDLAPERLETALVPPNLDSVIQRMQDQLSTVRSARPKTPLGIVWRSPMWDPSGYADDSRIVVKALARHDRPLRVEAINWSQSRCELPEDESALFRALERAERPQFKAVITHCIPTLAPMPDPTASLNVIRTTFETDRIPADWLGILDHYDEVWGITEHDRLAFRRAGVPPEKMRVLNEFIDTERFAPRGRKRKLDARLEGRFVFLSLFDWQLRKGWDLLLPAYCDVFREQDGVGLLLKITTAHGHTDGALRQQIERACPEALSRSDIVILRELLSAEELPTLYRTVDAFVLPTRGEGWGRPFMEAMASRLPVIGTRGCGSDAFMSDENSFLLDSQLVEVSEEASVEIPVYRGHRWREPELEDLKRQLRVVVDDEKLRTARAKRARSDMVKHFPLQRAGEALLENLTAAESRFRQQMLPEVAEDQIRVEIEGELFASHSFANVNAALLSEFAKHPELAPSLNRKFYNPVANPPGDATHHLLAYVERELPGGPQVVIRHAFPPNWTPLPDGVRWVHIQPWEFGHLPLEWLAALRTHVDEIWAPSHYVRSVYERSGIPQEKIEVIPWGIDPVTYTPEAPPLFLPTEKRFRFLFMGGTISRKGFDILLEAYQSEFTAEDDVCLVIKDVGTDTFYRYGNFRETVLSHIQKGNSPEILYLDCDYTDGQRASLLTACHCLVAPYRGEGFGLPILEAMACGLPAIVPKGGASDDFVTEETGYFIDSEEVECDHDWRLCGPAVELSPNLSQLQSTLREVTQQSDRAAAKGQLASRRVHDQFTWKHTADAMAARLKALVETPARAKTSQAEVPTLTACVLASCEEGTLGDCLGRIRPYVRELIVVDLGSADRSASIAQEYGARVYPGSVENGLAAARNIGLSKATSDWILVVDADEQVDEAEMRKAHSFLQSVVSFRWTCMNQPARFASVTVPRPSGAEHVPHKSQPASR